MRFSTGEIAAATGGQLVHGAPDITVEGVSTDSRTLLPGQLFVPLRARRDGHEFIAAAVEAGAPAYLTDGPRPAPAAAIEVDDTLEALTALAASARRRITGTVVGITGSSGKTSTKDFCAATFGPGSWAARESFNNEIGVPLTLAGAPEESSAVVCEMGSRGLGHLTFLCRVVRPDIGIVTTVGVAHLEMFGSPEKVAAAKAELPASLPAEGWAVLPADSPWLEMLRRDCVAQVVLFGLFPGADVTAEALSFDDLMRARFILRSPWGSAPVSLRVIGDHQVSTALAAAAAALAAGRRVEAVAESLAGATLSRWRMEVHEAGSGVIVINDAYNANPQSMAAALDVLRRLSLTGRRSVAVLGEMAELGALSEEEHRRAGLKAAQIGRLALLVTVGDAAHHIAAGAREAGARVVEVERPEDAVRVVRDVLEPGDAVLVKGSRVARLERVAGALVAGAP